MKFRMNTDKGEGTSWGKLNVITGLIWFSFFFQIVISLLAYVATFLAQLYYGRSYFFRLFQSNYFDTIVTFRNDYFFSEGLFRISLYKKELLFQSRYFYTASTFSEKLRSAKNWFFRKSISALSPFSGELS